MDKDKTTSLSEVLNQQMEIYFRKINPNEPKSHLFSLVIHEVEQTLIKKTLEYTGGNRSKAAKILGINRNTLNSKIMGLNRAK